MPTKASAKATKPTPTSAAGAPAPGARVLIASPRATGAPTPASLPTNTRAREALTRHLRPGAPERMTSRPRSAIERQKSNLTEAGEIAPGTAKPRAVLGWAKVKSGRSFQQKGGLRAAARCHPVDPQPRPDLDRAERPAGKRGGGGGVDGHGVLGGVAEHVDLVRAWRQGLGERDGVAAGGIGPAVGRLAAVDMDAERRPGRGAAGDHRPALPVEVHGGHAGLAARADAQGAGPR